MGRVAVALSFTEEVTAELKRMARSRRGEIRLAERARIVLGFLQGLQNREVACALGVRTNTVGLWRWRFAKQGLSSLHDAARPGKPVKYGKDLRNRLLTPLEFPSPPGQSHSDIIKPESQACSS